MGTDQSSSPEVKRPGREADHSSQSRMREARTTLSHMSSRRGAKLRKEHVFTARYLVKPQGQLLSFSFTPPKILKRLDRRLLLTLFVKSSE